MNVPTIDERQWLWRYIYSRASFIETLQTARLLLRLQNSVTQDHCTALLTALVVTYARPFTVAQIDPKRRIIPMHGIPVPSEHIELHNTYLEMRNQVFGHKDATGPSTKWGVLNQVHFIFKNGFLNLHTIKTGSYDSQKLNETEILAKKLITILDSKIDDFIEKYPFPSFDKTHTYVLNLDDPTKPWIVTWSGKLVAIR